MDNSKPVSVLNSLTALRAHDVRWGCTMAYPFRIRLYYSNAKASTL